MTDRYASLHEPSQLNGAGDGRPTALQIVKDNNLVGKWSDKVILITGTSSGIGVETARALSATGARVFLTARDLKKGESALQGILEPGRVELLHLELGSLASVRSCANEFLTKSSKLNILINNAGIMALPELTKTEDGFEAQFGTNHLGHFLLFQMLKDTLISSSTPTFQSRVVNLSSSGHKASGVHFDDLNLEAPNAYQPSIGYGQSKTANIYMANEIERRYSQKGLHAHSVMPGGIWTGLQVHMDMSPWRGKPEVERMVKSTEQGAATTVWAAVDAVWEGKGGKYLENCQVSPPAHTHGGYAAWAYDEDAAKQLWEVSCRLVGVPDE